MREIRETSEGDNGVRGDEGDMGHEGYLYKITCALFKQVTAVTLSRRPFTPTQINPKSLWSGIRCNHCTMERHLKQLIGIYYSER
jgi:hypothetical protein